MIAPFLQRFYSNAPLLLILAMAGWAGNAISSLLAVGEVSPMMLVFLRWGIVVALLFSLNGRAIIAERSAISQRLTWVLLMGGCGLCFFNALFYIAGHTSSALNIGIIQTTMPGMILFGSFLFFGTRINNLQIVGLVLTLIGGVVIITQGSLERLMLLTVSIGDLLALLAFVFYSAYSLGLKNRPQISGMVMLGYFSVAAFLMTIPLVVIESAIYGMSLPTQKGWMIVIYVAVVPSLISQVFFMRGVDLIGPGPAGLYANLVPVFAAFMAVILLDEIFSVYHLVAMIIVFAGIGLFERQKRSF